MTTQNQAIKTIGGWLSETEAAKLVGVAQGRYMRRLPIPRTDVSTPGSKYARYRYRLEDVQSYIRAKTIVPDMAG